MSAKTKAWIIIGCVLLVIGGIPLVLPPAIVTRSKGSCVTNLRMIDAAKEIWAQENHKQTNDVPTMADLAVGPKRYIKYPPECADGGRYVIGRVDEPPACSIQRHTTYFEGRQ